MSGPPQINLVRGAEASLAGEVDSIVLLRIAVWLWAGIWIFAHVYPSVLRRTMIPQLSTVQVVGAFLIVSLSLSLPQSPGVLLTAFTLGQYAVMLGFAWLFVHRFGVFSYLSHLFMGATVLAGVVAAAAFVFPDLVIQGTRLRGDGIADAGTVSVIGLVFCLSNVPPLKRKTSWALIILFGVLLVVSRTRVAYVAFLIYLAVGYVYGKGLPVRKLVPLLALASIGLLLAEVFNDATGYLVRETESVRTLSDRIPLWGFLTDVVMRESPLTGLGYYAASRVWAPQYNEALGNAHSAFFEILLGGGIIAAILYISLCALLVFQAGALLRNVRGRPEVLVTVALLGVTLLLAATSVAVHVGPSGFTFWSLSAVIPALRRQYARAPSTVRQQRQLRPLVARGPIRSGSPSPGR